MPACCHYYHAEVDLSGNIFHTPHMQPVNSPEMRLRDGFEDDWSFAALANTHALPLFGLSA